MEIERKFLVNKLPDNLQDYPCRRLEQGYLCTRPVIRPRMDGDTFYLTYKGKGKMAREEVNLPLTEEAYLHLMEKTDGYHIVKNRYRIPLPPDKDNSIQLTAELDIFTEPGPLTMVEVEFPSESAACAFIPPAWFGEEVTDDKRYHNAHMSRFGVPS